MLTKSMKKICLCGSEDFSHVFLYAAPPQGETVFPFSNAGAYHREVMRCNRCSHYLSIHAMDESALYTGQYVNATYGEEGMLRAFHKINALDPSKSDNIGRVRRVNQFAEQLFGAPVSAQNLRSVLDIGSGLCVFLYRMREAGWSCCALDPDERAVRHARKQVRVDAVRGDLMTLQTLGRFDAVTLNKVLEHVKDPIGMLVKVREHVKPGGFVYIELPDGEIASRDGQGREEFFIEHHHVFSFQSIAILVEKAGFERRCVERLKEPSGKYTLRAFLVPRPDASRN